MAIEASNLTEKDELIAKFYTIRAGLSVIAEESGKIRTLESEIEDLEWKDVEHREKSRKEAKSRKWDLEYKLQKVNEEIESKQYNLRYDKNRKNALVEKGSKEYRPKLPTGVIATVCIVGFLIIAAVFMAITGPISDGFLVFLVYAIPTAFVITVIALCKKWQCKKGDEKWREQIDELDRIIKRQENSIRMDESEVERYRQEIDVINNDQLPAICNSSPNGNQIALLKDKFSKVLSISTEKSKQTRNVLLKEFGDILTEDDWCNVDLLIFYLNTGRADSLKEALQLVDAQRQTNQIVHAIGAAAAYVSNTMQENTYRLARVMNDCFSNLSNQINHNHKELVGAISDLNDSFTSQIGSFESTVRAQSNALLKAEEFNASLLEKANLNSDQLMNELRYNQKYWVK